MEEVIVLPPGVALGIIAFLLSLLPAGLFIWVWYLRRADRPVPASTVAITFLAGFVLVAPAYFLEHWAVGAWTYLSPGTSHYFVGAVLPLTSWIDILLPAFGTFGIVALVEEGVRYVWLRVWFRYNKKVDQVFDGLVLGLAAGLGFATLENTLYFLDLFNAGNVNTLVFVFFLRFMMSTLAHTIFGGLMGALIARGLFSMYGSGRLLRQAFLVPWLAHGLYDLLLSVNLSTYAILLIIPSLAVLLYWYRRPDFLIINRKQGKWLVFEEAPQTKQRHLLQQFLEQFESPWNAYAPWLRERRKRSTLISEFIKNA